MVYKRGDFGIGIGNLPKNKRKCLYIQEGACIRKVATFCSDEDAEIFDHALEYLLGLKDKATEIKNEGTKLPTKI